MDNISRLARCQDSRRAISFTRSRIEIGVTFRCLHASTDGTTLVARCYVISLS